MKQKQSAWIRMQYNTQDYLKHTMAIMMVPPFQATFVYTQYLHICRCQQP